jgi:hypothetical protein
MRFENHPITSASRPGDPPAAALDAVGAAADRAEELAEHGWELHFETDGKTGRVIVQVRDLASGQVIREISSTDALATITGGAHAGSRATGSG